MEPPLPHKTSFSSGMSTRSPDPPSLFSMSFGVTVVGWLPDDDVGVSVRSIVSTMPVFFFRRQYTDCRRKPQMQIIDGCETVVTTRLRAVLSMLYKPQHYVQPLLHAKWTQIQAGGGGASSSLRKMFLVQKVFAMVSMLL